MDKFMKSLIASAKREITNIKKNASSQELCRLLVYINDLDGGDNSKCVYGLMTNNCHSLRAAELITKCASIYKIKGVNIDRTREGSFLDSKTEVGFVKHRNRTNNATYFSKLELLAVLNKDIVQKLIKQIL